MLPGTCAITAIVRPVTSTPSIVPLSKCHAMIVSHVPKSGSSPIQQGTDGATVADFEQTTFEVISHVPSFECEKTNDGPASRRPGA
jgi:hypothetical protein